MIPADIISQIAKDESVGQAYLLKHIASGEIVVPLNNAKYGKNIKACAIGSGLRTKVNANLGTSSGHSSINDEIEKLRVAVEAGADTVMDLSTGGDIARTRQEIVENSIVPVGTVPIYEAAVAAYKKHGAVTKMTGDDIFKALINQAKDGVDFFTVHCGITKESLERLIKQDRLIDIVSRGGAFLAEWIKKNKKENPLYEDFDEVLNIAKKYDITLSLGDGMRPGTIVDATDRPQVQELILLGELAMRAYEAGVQVIIEGPGHVPLNQIETNMILQKRLCNNRPFYVLGPLVTDVAPGYDHITSAIGGAIAAASGADFLCYVTPSEHLGLPNLEDVYDGVIASRIAAHAADIAKGVKGAVDWDRKISEARKKRDWALQEKLSIAPKRFAKIRKKTNQAAKDNCTMCGEFCSMKVAEG
ncbi:MAG: phosphomethylpyrimidine synthase [Candidatus Omnitrophica bacterium CG_4_8_14_3_um_filter_43_15]|nr:MAG: phosphomethylpyrimidine synthase [Candidatus Omnitrophica bacterium CG1_02_43_210]PIR66151.1 MAG: phosphomethylpyrimidine synthase [Candidatus Omnitrophica bacterium CG10_big_fil_rev_8_21_14_0_10_43_8]PIV12412.1 MAG: phosphomethylpyrimidine synthase [Candidatus Omnitrophica bacterium CG03_land_8_20_14_0_80_43_22]PIW80433.1 MAG: phosphomethylpyrimidine synthase [Candidatus Omnitrophica bacterium CG_4_8_14_3_um_filter_43_15]PIY84693.1 MAG: phosphomethylpyrimidine synthase [Candidatus Omni